jgi:hypothetical protein
MLSPQETSLQFGHRIDAVGTQFVVVNERGEVQERTASESKAIKELRKLRGAWLNGKYHSTDAPPPAGRIAVA